MTRPSPRSGTVTQVTDSSKIVKPPYRGSLGAILVLDMLTVGVGGGAAGVGAEVGAGAGARVCAGRGAGVGAVGAGTGDRAVTAS